MHFRPLLPFLATALAAHPAVAQTPTDSVLNPWCDYHRGTLRQVLDSASRAIPRNLTTQDRVVLWHSPFQQVRAYLVYSGRSGPLPPGSESLLDSATRDTLWRSAYHTAVLFTEDEVPVLLIVSDSLGAALQRDVAPGDSVWAFASVHGLVPGREPYFVITLDEFGTSREVGTWGSILSRCSRRRSAAG